MNGNVKDIHTVTNGRARDLVSVSDLPDAAASDFDYVEGDDRFTPRMFQYRGSWYDTHEFERATGDVFAAGWQGVQAQSYFDAVAIRYVEEFGYIEDAVVVAHLHW